MKFALLFAAVSAVNIRQREDPPKYSEQPAGDSDAFGGYTRVIPERFTQERDDRLMNSIVTKYAREIKLDGEPTGHMYCNHDDALSLAKEV